MLHSLLLIMWERKYWKLGTTQKSTSTTSTSAVTSNASLTKTSSVVTSDVSSVVENVMPSIVSITNMSVQEVQNYFGGTSSRKVKVPVQESSFHRMIQNFWL